MTLDSTSDAIGALNDWIESYNREYLHSAPGYQSPERFEEEFNLCHKTSNQIA
jgi:hypothetical protein